MKKEKNVLIVTDMQNDFIDKALGTKEAETIVSNTVKKIEKAVENDDIIIVTRDTHTEDTYMASEEGKNLPVIHCVRYSQGWELNKDIVSAIAKANQNNVYIIDKPTFGSFELGEKLRVLLNIYDIKIIELIGLCTDICVISNAVIAKAAIPNAHIIVDAACCAGVTPEAHDTALDEMKSIQVEVINRGNEPWR